MSSSIRRPHYTGTDSRVYTTSRLVSFHGFEELPVVDDGMLFHLPRFHHYHSRVVFANDRRWMIWSANSEQDPFYPGPRTTIGVLFRDAELSQRRYDGRGGRWDHTRVPQAYSAIRPWLGFIYRENGPGNQNVEFASVHSVWEPTNSYLVGKLQNGFMDRMIQRNEELDRQMRELLPTILAGRPTLCPYRPKTPTRADLAGLAAAVQYERAVDLAAECQAGMKEKCAWARMARKWLEKPFSEPYVLESLEIVPAEDACIGVWINGAEAADPLWFLVVARVPCFVIHELPQGIPAERVTQGFVVGTDVEINRALCEFDRIGLLGGVVSPVELRPLAAMPAPRTLQERLRAGLRWQMDISDGRWLPAIVSDTTEEPPAESPHAREKAEPMDEELSSPAPTSETLAPPPVAAPARAAGPWTVFAEDEDKDGEPRMKKRGARLKGKGDMVENQEMWYDRMLKRKLIFDDLPPAPEGYPADEEYGRPVPEWPFGMDSNGRWISEISSMWMYRREAPTPSRIGEVPDSPRNSRSQTVSLPDEDMPQIFEDDIAPQVPVSPTRSDRTERPLSEPGRASSRETTPPPVSSPRDDPMRSPSPGSSSPDSVPDSPPQVRDTEGREPSIFVLLRGIPSSWTADSLRRWTRTIGHQDSPLRLRDVYRVDRGGRIDVLIEFYDEHDAQVFMLRARDNVWISRGAVYYRSPAANLSTISLPDGRPRQIFENPVANASSFPPSYSPVLSGTANPYEVPEVYVDASAIDLRQKISPAPDPPANTSVVLSTNEIQVPVPEEEAPPLENSEPSAILPAVSFENPKSATILSTLSVL
ncbi:hypothetical protein B0H15DRAFT_958048 [Mycena belliarum]|uniref:Uncharacterized protein n=1 Tax=Mycena belliarum TaxID=1033014 RepID=A0AAD6TMH2_9AGAR|nr:hypothetical protein B0H15DRAFT_958048 [Mycena belliae]